MHSTSARTGSAWCPAPRPMLFKTMPCFSFLESSAAGARHGLCFGLSRDGARPELGLQICQPSQPAGLWSSFEPWLWLCAGCPLHSETWHSYGGGSPPDRDHQRPLKPDQSDRSWQAAVTAMPDKTPQKPLQDPRLPALRNIGSHPRHLRQPWARTLPSPCATFAARHHHPQPSESELLVLENTIGSSVAAMQDAGGHTACYQSSSPCACAIHRPSQDATSTESWLAT